MMIVSRLKHGRLHLLTTVFAAAAGLCACSAPVGTLYYGTLAKGQPTIVVASAKNSSNDGSNAVVSYDINGNFLDELADLTSPNQRPRGLAAFDPFNIVVALDGSAKILSKNSLFGSYSTLVPSSSISGSLYQIGRHKAGANDYYYAIVGNTIDAFDKTGARVSTTSSPVIGTTTGSCVLNGPRGLFIDSDNNRLFVTNGGSTSLLVYDLSTPAAPTCQTASTALGGVSPYGVIKHSNGYLYVTSNISPALNVKLWALDGDGTGAATAVYTDASGSVLNMSTAIAELPDGTILIANSGTNQIDRFQVDGLNAATRNGTTAFIKDVFTTMISAILVIGGQ